MKMTSIISGVMAVSVVLVVLSAFLNLVDVVAIISNVIGKQDNGLYGLVALLLGVAALAVFVYAYRLSTWNWNIWSALIALSGIIFLIAIAGMTENFRMKLGSGDDFTWSEGRSFGPREVIRVVYDTFAVVDIDFVLIMMLTGSSGIAVATLWGAVKWESATAQETKDEELRSIPDEVLAKLLQEELGRPPGWSLADANSPVNSESSGQPDPVVSATSAPYQPPAPTPPPPVMQQAPSPPQPAGGRRRRCPECWAELEPDARSCAACGAGE